MTSLAQVAAAEFLAQSEQFAERVRQLGLPDVIKYYWYHTIDLGDGLVTPGLYDYRETIDAFQFPADMHGMTVLDVGSATGFFAFEFERRGARVTSLELPSLERLDRFPGQSLEQSIAKIERMIFPDDSELKSFKRGDTARDLYWYLLEGPFRFCYDRLHSRVERVYSTVYDVSFATPGIPAGGFDVVFIGDVLVHTLHPLDALASLAPLCRGTLILAQDMPDYPDAPAAVVYTGGDDPDEDHLSWWLPTRQCLTEILKKLRFRTVEYVGNHQGVLRPTAFPFERTILHAKR